MPYIPYLDIDLSCHHFQNCSLNFIIKYASFTYFRYRFKLALFLNPSSLEVRHSTMTHTVSWLSCAFPLYTLKHFIKFETCFCVICMPLNKPETHSL